MQKNIQENVYIVYKTLKSFLLFIIIRINSNILDTQINILHDVECSHRPNKALFYTYVEVLIVKERKITLLIKITQLTNDTSWILCTKVSSKSNSFKLLHGIDFTKHSKCPAERKAGNNHEMENKVTISDFKVYT